MPIVGRAEEMSAKSDRVLPAHSLNLYPMRASRRPREPQYAGELRRITMNSFISERWRDL